MYTSDNKLRGAFLALAVLTAATLTFTFFQSRFTYEEVEIVVTGKESVVARSGDEQYNKYLIFTEDEVFENTDSVWYLKFDSSDYYHNLKEGELYRIGVYGWRIPIFSMYRNIVSYEEL